MSKKNILILLALIFFIIQCTFITPEFEKKKQSYRSINDWFFVEKIYSDATLKDDFEDNKVIVVLNKAASFNFKDYSPDDFPEINCIQVVDATSGTLELIRKQLKAKETGDWSEIDEYVKTGMLVNVDNFRRILGLYIADKNKEDVLLAIKLLEERDDILYVGPDYLIQLCALPNPAPSYLADQMPALNSVSLPAAWDITTGSTDLYKTYYVPSVGVLDTGIQAAHPAFDDRIVSYLSRDFTTSDPTGMVSPFGLEDPHGHGTHVAGIIGANGTGVTGVCWGVSLISLRVFNAYGYGSAFNVKLAIDYATTRGSSIRILNYSGGGNNNDIARYIAIQNYPGLFITAAGNDNNDNDASAFYPSNWTTSLNNLISVGALDNDDNRASFSNWGLTTVDLFAPGLDILSTYNNFDYITMPGTSMATPFVAGTAALIISLHPYMTGAQLKTAIRNSIDVLPQLSGLCNTGGKLNAYKAVTYIPIIGSIDINFCGVGTIGTFHLFSNNTWVIAEKGVLSHPIPYSPTPYSYPYNHFVEWADIPNEISTYLNQMGDIGIMYYVWVPVSSINRYRSYFFFTTISSTGVNIEITNYDFYHDFLLPTDMRKIKATVVM